MLVWRVVGWDQRFETRGTLRKRGPRAEIVVSTDIEQGEQQKLLNASGGFIAFAVWNLICRIAATSSRRGVLLQDGRPLTDADLSRLARFPLNLIQPALRLLESPEIGLLERVPLDQALVPAEIPAPLPRKPRIKPLLECPVCSADLTEYYQLQATPAPQVPEPVVSPSKPPATAPVPAPAPATEPTSAAKPRSKWRPATEMFLATSAEIREVARRFENGEMTQDEVYEFINSHYYDDTPKDDTANSDGDDEDDEEVWNEDLEQEYQSGVPPPRQGQWG